MYDEAIKKALECCFEWQCHKCPMLGKRLCKKSLRKHALDFINRLQERIEELEIITGIANSRKYYRKFVDEIFCKQEGNELSEPDFDYIYQLYFEQQAENEQLQRNLKQCENGYSQQLHLARCKIEELKSLCTSEDAIVKELRAEIKQAKSEAIKEFAERLKENQRTFIGDEYAYEFIPSIEIDVLLAEMVGGENA